MDGGDPRNDIETQQTMQVGAENEASGSTSSSKIQEIGIEMQRTTREPANANIETLKRNRKLCHAARTGDWKTVERILRSPQETKEQLLLRSRVLSSTQETALHIAVGANQVGFVKKLLDGIDKKERLNEEDVNGNTVLCTAAAAGSYEIVMKLLSTSNTGDLPFTRNNDKLTPANIAATFGHGAIALELFSRCKTSLTNEDKISLFFTCINNEIFDLALKLLNEDSELELECKRDFNEETALHLLARTPSVFSSHRQGIWNQNFPGCCFFTSSCKASSVQSQASKFLKALLRKLSEKNENVFKDVIKNPNNVLFEAAASGNYNLLAILIRLFPELIWEQDAEGKLIFHTAILKRDMKIFKLVYETGLVRVVLKSWEDPITEENILHFAAKLPTDDTLASIAGEAFQLAKEVSMFKEVERFVPASYRYKRNIDGATPRQLFTMEHQAMLKEAETWMKKNASYGLIVATLIVTVVYPAAFTLPDGNKTNHVNTALTVLAITNAIAMGLSTLSMILFVYILKSRYAEVNFISSLPTSFRIGLILVFVSLLALLISFGLVTYVDLKTI